MKYFTLAATLAVSASAFNSYEEYFADDDVPVCGKHFEEDRNRLCNLFLSCHPDKFNQGITGHTYCPSTCANFLQSFPRQMCKDDHWMSDSQAHKFTLDEDNMRVCYKKNHFTDEKCVDVQGFTDVGVQEAPAHNPEEAITVSGATPCNNPGCVGITLMWSNDAELRNDLDIYVDGPEGRIYYGRTSVGSGRLDTDAGQGTVDAVENIAWSENAPRGHYSVFVDNYSQSGNGVKDFTVAIRVDGGDFQLFQGSATGSRGNYNNIYSFDY